MTSRLVVHRWENLDLNKITEMVSRKTVSANSQVVSQVYLKRGAHIPSYIPEGGHSIYVLQGLLRMVVDGQEIIIGEGEIVQIPVCAIRQAEALDDTFAIEFVNSIRPT